MAGATIDHLISVTIFLGAILLFIGLFNQTIQTATLYQRHRYLATKTSDILDNMLLNPGYPTYWGRTNASPTSFGLQDPDFSQYRLSPYSLMRLNYTNGTPIYYDKTGQWYSNITMGFGKFLLVPYNEAINYSTASKLLGTNGTFGFILTVTPTVTVSISEIQTNPLTVKISVLGVGSPLAGANISYCLLTVGAGQGPSPAYTISYGGSVADNEGSSTLTFPGFDGSRNSYALIAYARLSGLVGIGYHEHVRYSACYVVPMVGDFGTGTVNIAHSWDLFGGDSASVQYNATFLLLTEDFTLSEIALENSTGLINSGFGHPYNKVTIPTYDSGIVVITYRKSAQETGIVLMPWGISSMGFPVSFGENPGQKEWVATDTRQVIINGIAYQAKLAMWSFEGYQVIG